MRILNFLADGQQLIKNGDFSGIVRGSKHYLKCQFNFKGNDWLHNRIAAVFYKGKAEYVVPLPKDGSCYIPDEVTDIKCFKVKLIGIKNDTRINTNIELIEQEG